MGDDNCKEICDLLEEACLRISEYSEEQMPYYIDTVKTAREYLAEELIKIPNDLTSKYVAKYILQLCGLDLKQYPEDSIVCKCFLMLKDKYIKLIYNKHKKEVDDYVDGKISRIKNGESVPINKYETIVGKSRVIKSTSNSKNDSRKIRLSEVRRKIRMQHCAQISIFPNKYLWEFEDVD